MTVIDPTGLESENPGNISTTTSGSKDYGYNNGSGGVPKGGPSWVIPGAMKTTDKDGNEIWVWGQLINGVFYTDTKMSGIEILQLLLENGFVDGVFCQIAGDLEGLGSAYFSKDNITEDSQSEFAYSYADNNANLSPETNTTIKDAIIELGKTDWGKKHPKIVNKLWDLYNRGKIKVSSILAEMKNAAGYYSPFTKNIVINERYLNDPKELAALLVHEGTHAYDHSVGNFWYGYKIKLSTEYRAKLNEEAVEIDLGMRESFSTNSEMYDYLVFSYCNGIIERYYNDMKWLKEKLRKVVK